jgi:RNA polymerase subunit RPABC4/transcription elongation factor Spt4
VGSASFGFVAGGLPAVAGPTAGSHTNGASVPYGDLVVPSGQTVTIQGPGSGGTYYQEGNITVQAGGTLIVQNTTLDFVQFLGDGSTIAQQFAHVYRFLDAGTVDFLNSTLTTDVNVLNFSAKLYVSVTGTFSAWNSSFEFPGWVEVTGSNAVATFNDSTIKANPGVQGIAINDSVTQPAVLTNDQLFAPTINVTAGAELNLFGSSYQNTYADNWTEHNVPVYPMSPPISATGLSIPAAGASFPLASFSLPVGASSWGLSQALLYPAESSGLGVSVAFTSGTGTATVNVVYSGTPYDIGTIDFAGGSPQTFQVGANSPLIHAMMTTGLPLYLDGAVSFTGDSSGAAVPVSNLSLNMTPATNFNLTVMGAGSRLNTVDSSIDLNFAPSFLNATVPAYPWDSNKLMVQAGALALLGNLTTPNAIPGNSSTSAVLTDSTSSVILYRWAEFNLAGEDNIHVADAAVKAYYAYGSTQLNNGTANTANDLATTSPAIWDYLQYWDAQHGLPSYGVSGVTGLAFLLLASSELNGSTLPTGNFLGDYHIEISVPATGLSPLWAYASVSPYPVGVAYLSPGYDRSDVQPTTTISGYFGAASLAAPVILANGTLAPDSVVREGQQLGVKVTLTDEGTAKIFNVNATLYWNATKVHGGLFNYTSNTVDLTAPGQNLTFNLTWVLNDSVTGLRGNFSNPFFVALTWNYGLPQLAGGVLNQTATVTITPSQMGLHALVPPPNPLNLNDQYLTSGVITYNGTGQASIFVVATPLGGGTPITVATGSAFPGKFDVVWSVVEEGMLSPGTTYTIAVTANYNGGTVTVQLPGTYSVPSSTSTSGFLYEKILGLPLWLWLVIAAAIVVAVVAVLLIFRRQAAGKLVECGECGELIPEDATVCPKCGAEFENDLVRCSRCSSTIPANSQFCPECGAQLLGKPGEGQSDPERQAYADFTERFRTEAKKELGDNYTESAFWDWWKRQPTYVPFSQWQAQQSSGAPRAGMSEPPAGTQMTADATAPGTPPPPGAAGAAPAAAMTATPTSSAPPPAAPGASAASGLKPCPSCGKEIPPEYLVCPFCGAVTQ